MTLGNPIIDATMLRLVTHIYDATRIIAADDTKKAAELINQLL